MANTNKDVKSDNKTKTSPTANVGTSSNDRTVISNDSMSATIEKHDPGRPIDVTSKRQQELLKRELKAQLGLLKKGRPVDPTSNRQKHITEINEKREKGLLKPGRPAYTEAERIEADKRKVEKDEARMADIRRMATELIKSQGTEALATVGE